MERDANGAPLLHAAATRPDPAGFPNTLRADAPPDCGNERSTRFIVEDNISPRSSTSAQGGIQGDVLRVNTKSRGADVLGRRARQGAQSWSKRQRRYQQGLRSRWRRGGPQRGKDSLDRHFSRILAAGELIPVYDLLCYH